MKEETNIIDIENMLVQSITFNMLDKVETYARMLWDYIEKRKS